MIVHSINVGQFWLVRWCSFNIASWSKIRYVRGGIHIFMNMKMETESYLSGVARGPTAE